MEENCQYGIWKNRLPSHSVIANMQFILMILFWSCYNVSLHFSCVFFFLCQRYDSAFKIELRKKVNVNLRSIRFSYVFVRFFTFLLLLDKVCAFSSAFL